MALIIGIVAVYCGGPGLHRTKKKAMKSIHYKFSVWAHKWQNEYHFGRVGYQEVFYYANEPKKSTNEYNSIKVSMHTQY